MPSALVLMALAPGRIPYQLVLLIVFVMTTLHLGRDDRGKENAVFPPSLMASRLELKIGTLLQVRFGYQRHNMSGLCGIGPPHTINVY